MRRIEKKHEPPCLEQLRNTPGANWSSATGSDKQEMREHALAEQGGLCAYCMSYLPKPDEKTMKIEHFEARASSSELTFEWQNLLGVCLGRVSVGEDDTSRERDKRYHCDTYRGFLRPENGGQDLFVHPARFPPDAGTLFSFTTAGEIRATQHLPESERQTIEKTIERLNLNIDQLKRNREAVVATLRANFKKLNVRNKITVGRVQKMLQEAKVPDGEGRLKEYAQVAVDYLEKKLRSMR